MGSPPPPDGPPPEEQAAIDASASFEAGPPVTSLCGLEIPSFSFSFGLLLSGISFPPPIPKIKISLGISCDANNPIDVTAGVEYGGGRVATFDPDPDLAEE